MLFWTAAAILTLLASMAVLLPMARRTLGNESARNEIEVYRDQLAEIERDLARGSLEAGEAEQARAEIGRRIIKADASAQTRTASASLGGWWRMAAAAAVLSVPLVSWGLYGALGSPNMPSEPLAGRLAKDPRDSTVDELVARAEAQLAGNPDDLRGWDILAPIYFRLNRFDDAISAYRNAMRLGGGSAARLAGVGEAIVYAGGGIVSAEARAAFEAALKDEPNYPKAVFFLAMARSQEGDKDGAIAEWSRMAAALPPDNPWGSAASQMAAAAKADGAPAEDRAVSGVQPATIEQMVAGLDQRLRENPDDAEGWKRLIRSYVVLGKAEEARAALARAMAALGSDSAAGKDIAVFAGEQGVKVE